MDAQKDPLDLRDVYYEPALGELPFAIDNRKTCGDVLDQGAEGACTGFGLAAVANYLLRNRSDREGAPPLVSPRMLYEMAKRHDEWEGEEYSGSSIRGAMKGWNKHGVCPKELWPYVVNNAGRLTPERQQAALDHRLGAYYRVRHLYLNHMHGALHEAGIIYASAKVHSGWERPDRNAHIPFEKDDKGGHAFAIVGYDKDGFWVQNSWGTGWGDGGFAHLRYEDWLENGFDCWVARLGVPTSDVTVEETIVGGRVSVPDYMPDEAAVLDEIGLHYVNLGNDGQFSQSGTFTSDEESVEEIIGQGIKPHFRKWGQKRRLMVYAHGGLVNEKSAASGIRRMRSHFLENQIYPLHFIWETGPLETVQAIIEDAFRRRQMMGWRDELKERFQDLLDEAIELGSRRFGMPFWSQMKDNAERASFPEPSRDDQRPEGGAAFLARKLADLANQDDSFELHLVGHSAGGVFQSFLIPRLLALGLKVKTLTLFAPACTTELFRSHVLSSLGDGVERLTIFNLMDKYEREDNVTALYDKSILYLVSEAFERKRGMPLLGMEKFINDDRRLKRTLGRAVQGGASTLIYSVGGPAVRLQSSSTTHGDFDNDADTLNSTLRIVKGTNQIGEKF
jgi:hypothetical protein